MIWPFDGDRGGVLALFVATLAQIARWLDEAGAK